jgi:hypothetical protein
MLIPKKNGYLTLKSMCDGGSFLKMEKFQPTEKTRQPA